MSDKRVAFVTNCPNGHQTTQWLSPVVILREDPDLTFTCERCGIGWEPGLAMVVTLRRSWEAMTPPERRAGVVLRWRRQRKPVRKATHVLD